MAGSLFYMVGSAYCDMRKYLNQIQVQMSSQWNHHYLCCCYATASST